MGYQFPPRLQDYLVRAVEDPLKENGLVVQRTDFYDEDFSLFSHAAIIGLMADGFRGTFILCIDQTLLEKSHPMVKAGRELSDAMAQDWLGELTNLAVGKLKLFLAGHGIQARITPPSIEGSPEKVLTDYSQMKPTQRFWLAAGSDTVVCQLSADVEGVDFEAEPTSLYM